MKTKRQVDCTDAAIDVKLHPVAQLEMSMHILGPQAGSRAVAETGKNLAPMGMSGEDQVDLSPDA